VTVTEPHWSVYAGTVTMTVLLTAGRSDSEAHCEFCLSTKPACPSRHGWFRVSGHIVERPDPKPERRRPGPGLQARRFTLGSVLLRAVDSVLLRKEKVEQ
jgi:hypothetical protein